VVTKLGSRAVTSARLGRLRDANGELGAAGLRGWTERATDPQNLIWVMPAEEAWRWTA